MRISVRNTQGYPDTRPSDLAGFLLGQLPPPPRLRGTGYDTVREANFKKAFGATSLCYMSNEEDKSKPDRVSRSWQAVRVAPAAK
jgi:hypothetical protein